jgi:hypothetical protein
MVHAIMTLLVALFAMPVTDETVDVKSRGIVDLRPLVCTDTPRSTHVQRVCYDAAQSYLLINVRGTYYQYCEMPLITFNRFVTAPSMGQFFSQKIDGNGSGSPFDCRTHYGPPY